MKQSTQGSSTYALPLRVSESTALEIAGDFLEKGKSRTRLLLLCSALFEIVAFQRGTRARVKRGNTPGNRRLRPNVFDLECINGAGSF